MKFYFIYYKCETYGWEKTEGFPDWVSTGMVEQFAQEVTNVHPLQWQIDLNKKYNKETVTTFGTMKKSCYTVISWQNLTQEEFNNFNFCIG